MTTLSTTPRSATDDSRLRLGSAIMAVGGPGFLGYGVIFFTPDYASAAIRSGSAARRLRAGADAVGDLPSLTSS